ncbi:MAG: hypothetical protein ABI388_13035 [Bacteroidia bacterium]
MPNQIISSPFAEHPIVDSSQTEAQEFDITAFNSEQVSSFLQSGKFLLQQYCACLLHKLVSLPKSKIKAFIQYQCTHLSDPFTWLNKLEKLIDLNREQFTTKEQNTKIEKALVLIELIRQDIENNKFNPVLKYDFDKVKSKIKSYNDYEEKLSFLMEARTEYLQNKPLVTNPNETSFDEKINLEIDLLKTKNKLSQKRMAVFADKKSPTSPTNNSVGLSQKIQFNCQTNVFVDVFYQLHKEIIIDGKPLLDIGFNDLAQFIITNFVDKNKNDLSLNTVKTILNSARPEKRPNSEKRIKLNIK